MPGDDPTDQFEYLFGPIDGDATTTEAPVATSEVPGSSTRRRRRSLLLLAGATVVGAVVGLILVLVRPERVEAVPTSDVPVTRPSAPSATITSQPVKPSSPVPPPPEPATTVTPEPSRPAAPPQAPAPAPAPASSTASEPAPRQAPGPSLRPPLSVSPEPRPAFPNQPGGSGNEPDGGLLGGGLPGPLVYRP